MMSKDKNIKSTLKGRKMSNRHHTASTFLSEPSLDIAVQAFNKICKPSKENLAPGLFEHMRAP